MDSSIRILEFQLINRYSRQFFDVDYDGVNVRYLYDSGAKIPVWCTGVNKFLEVFPLAKKLKETCQISGFGKGIEDAEVYVIPLFSISDENNNFEIEQLSIAMLTKPYIGCDFLISETMFSKIDTFTFRREKHLLQLFFEECHYRCTTKRNSGNITDIAVWTQLNGK